MFGEGGNDILDGKTGVDELNGGKGNDLLKVTDYNRYYIDGDNGFDALEITGSDQQIDLNNPDTFIVSIESIKFSGAGNNYLSFNARDLSSLLLFGNGTTLEVIGASNDDTCWQSAIGQ